MYGGTDFSECVLHSILCTVECGYSCVSASELDASDCTTLCGDGMRRGLERCDDGNIDDGDGCSSNCSVEESYACSGALEYWMCGGPGDICEAGCGLGTTPIDSVKECDDGNSNSNDGCSTNCHVECGWTCSGGGPGDNQVDVCSAVCGDGARGGDEQCDDGNLETGDGCSAGCGVEIGYTCVHYEPPDYPCGAYVSLCTPVCGDGMVVGWETGAGRCEDGNVADRDGCSSACIVECGFTCSSSVGSASDPYFCNTSCGDGLLAGTEECDDENLLDGDGCSKFCTVEESWTCSSEACSSSLCLVAVCGDGVRVGEEECDDGGNTANDGCSSDCKIQCGFICTGGEAGNGADTCSATCGDGVKSYSAEECDDGNLLNGDGCSSTCTVETSAFCSQVPCNISVCAIARCGDGFLSSDEQCEDSNTEEGDGCSSSCEIECGYTCAQDGGGCTTVCGDGKLAGSEQCDDGNLADGDGCDVECEIETSFTCTDVVCQESFCSQGICGDGYITGGETNMHNFCDDGNLQSGDGCGPECQVECGFYCTGGDFSGPDTCETQCGDGVRAGNEACDDGNADANDGCHLCLTEPGWICTLPSCRKSACTPICGDGIVLGNEECDDGNLRLYDGCTGCRIDCGFSCTADGECTTICGDGIQTGSEACDDGNSFDSDGCSSLCRIENGFRCPRVPCGKSLCEEGVCGDGVVTGVEVNVSQYCDDGNQYGWDGCSWKCNVECGYSCSGGGVDSSDTCITVCGDGLVVGAEECDDGNDLDGDGCSIACTIEIGWQCADAGTCSASTCSEGVCGDGLLTGPEFGQKGYCDDGNDSDQDGCLGTCEVGCGYTCSGGSSTTPDSCDTECGDGLLAGAEGCDDGNLVSGDGCSNMCVVELDWECTAIACAQSVCKTEVCGDGKVTGDEGSGDNFCDDGNTVDFDGCSALCQVECGFQCEGGSEATADTCLTVCGDASRTGNETCDDGNVVDGDGCNSFCEIEEGFTCTNTDGFCGLSTCEGGVCGDGKIFGSESTAPGYCDDSNLQDGDGCSATCSVECGYTCEGGTASTEDTCYTTCGDGVFVSAFEACDDGNVADFDGCSAQCTIEALSECVNVACEKSSCNRPVCGDGLKNFGEINFPGRCDDGNTESLDGCSSTCQEECGYNCFGASSQPGEFAKIDTCTKICGDAVRAESEECDDGNRENGDGCSSECTIEDTWRCIGQTCQISFCEVPVCGDGKRITTELDDASYCDDGNTVSGDGCSATCAVECGFVCTSDSTENPEDCKSTCGDGIQSSEEVCDDGNTVSYDGCSANCYFEHGFECTHNACHLTVCSEPCGNGLKSWNEGCDDNNSEPGDGCSSSCTVECGFDCGLFQPSECISTCGDGIQASDEKCDDGNDSNNDGCDSSCFIEAGYTCSTPDCALSVCGTMCGDGYAYIRISIEFGRWLSRGCMRVCACNDGEHEIAHCTLPQKECESEREEIKKGRRRENE